MPDTWLITWDDIGLEGLVNLSSLERARVESILKDEIPNSKSASDVLAYYVWRSRFNTQRNYEVWVINISDTISNELIKDAFSNDKMAFTTLIRKKGIKAA